MCEVMFDELHVVRHFLPKLDMPIRRSCYYKVCLLCHAYMRDRVSVHVGTLIHFCLRKICCINLIVVSQKNKTAPMIKPANAQSTCRKYKCCILVRGQYSFGVSVGCE